MAFSRGPPLLPGFTAASVWIIHARDSSWNPYDDITPVVTLSPGPMRPPGKPSMATSDPTLMAEVATVGSAFQRGLQQIVTTARSRISSSPVTVPVRVPEPSCSRTVTVREPLMTCSLVRIHALPLLSTR